MYVINNMDFYVKISDATTDELNTAKKVEYVTMTEATQFDSMLQAATAAEEMAIYGYDIVKYKSEK